MKKRWIVLTLLCSVGLIGVFFESDTQYTSKRKEKAKDSIIDQAAFKAKGQAEKRLFDCLNGSLADCNIAAKSKELSTNQITKAINKANTLKRNQAKNDSLGEWSYSTYVDQATGKQAKRGSLTSKNSMNFGFPYSGTQYGRFVVRNHPRYGVDAYLSINEGQLLCDNYSNTSVLVRFDNGAASSYTCNSPADHSSQTVFIEGVGRLEGRMKTAKKMYVTINVYGEGSNTWEFNVKGYDRSKI